MVPGNLMGSIRDCLPSRSKHSSHQRQQADQEENGACGGMDHCRDATDEDGGHCLFERMGRFTKQIDYLI